MRADRHARGAAVIAATVCGCTLLAASALSAQETDTTAAVSVSVTADSATAVSATADSVVLVSGSETAAGRAIARVLRRPHTVIDARGRPVNIPRTARLDSSIVVLTPRLTIAGNVAGDVLVVGGDLFTHPGAHIQGDAIAVGGGVYQSSLALVDGGVEAFRDETFSASRSAPRLIALAHESRRVAYEQATITLPLRVGLRVPSYTRVDGVVLPWGPIITLARGRIVLDPTATYRSDLGNVEPGLRVVAEFGSLRVNADARRATFSNDRWIRNELANSATALLAGRDTRNYYRADRIELRVGALLRPGLILLEPYAGVRNELAWSTGGELSRDSHPWSAFGHDSIDGIFRPNPPISHTRIVSTLLGGTFRWNPEDVQLRLSAEYEAAWDRTLSFPAEGAPPPPDSRFRQLTLHGTVNFPTFAGQRLYARAHAVTSTSGDRRPPPQRYAYLGGSGTLPTMDVLEEGGTELFYLGANYLIPLPIINLPYLGSPNLTLRYMTGAAGIDELPPLTQNIGARLGFNFIAAQFVMDPQTREKEFGIGLTFAF